MEQIKKQLSSTMLKIMRFRENIKETPQLKRTEGFLQGRIDLLNRSWEKFNDLYDERYQLADEVDLQDEYFTRYQFSQVEIIYSETLGELTVELKALTRNEVSEPSRSSVASTGPSDNTHLAHLPKSIWQLYGLGLIP